MRLHYCAIGWWHIFCHENFRRSIFKFAKWINPAPCIISEHVLVTSGSNMETLQGCLGVCCVIVETLLIETKAEGLTVLIQSWQKILISKTVCVSSPRDRHYFQRQLGLFQGSCLASMQSNHTECHNDKTNKMHYYCFMLMHSFLHPAVFWEDSCSEDIHRSLMHAIESLKFTQQNGQHVTYMFVTFKLFS